MKSRQYIFWAMKSFAIDFALFIKKKIPTPKELWLALKYSPFIMVGGCFFIPSVWETKLCTKFAQPGYINGLNKKLKWQWTATAVCKKAHEPEWRDLQLECKSDYFEDERLIFSNESRKTIQEIKEKHTWKSESCILGINLYIEEDLIGRHKDFFVICIIILALMSLPWPLGEILKDMKNAELALVINNAAKEIVISLATMKNAMFFFGGFLIGNILSAVDIIKRFSMIEAVIGIEVEEIERECLGLQVFRDLENKKAADTLKAMVGTVNQKSKAVAL